MLTRYQLSKSKPCVILGRVLNSIDSHLNGLKMAKSGQTVSNSWLISQYYLRYFPCLTVIYLIFIAIFKTRTRPSQSNMKLAPLMPVGRYLPKNICMFFLSLLQNTCSMNKKLSWLRWVIWTALDLAPFLCLSGALSYRPLRCLCWQGLYCLLSMVWLIITKKHIGI